MKKSIGSRFFDSFNIIFLTLVSLLCVAPMLYILAMSLSSNSAIVSNRVTFWPVDFTLVGYRYIMGNKLFLNAFLNSVIRVFLGVSVQLLITCLAAYPLSRPKEKFFFRTLYAWIVFIPMMVGGGLIPTYMIVRETGLLDSIWALIIPGAVPVYYILLLLNFFRQLPYELEEAAIIDGAGSWYILFRVYLPLAKPALATIAIYSVLGQWNSWFDGAIYLDSLSKFPLLTYLRSVIVRVDPETMSVNELLEYMEMNTKTMQSAQIFVASLPMLLVYPFFQKYFTKGLVIGSVKG